jgi:hypothetical protein
MTVYSVLAGACGGIAFFLVGPFTTRDPGRRNLATDLLFVAAVIGTVVFTALEITR